LKVSVQHFLRVCLPDTCLGLAPISLKFNLDKEKNPAEGKKEEGFKY
jgi:hypothetical protein